MYIEKIKLTNKKDILMLDEIGERIRRHLLFDPSVRKLDSSHYEISQINMNNKILLKYTFFYKNITKVFLIDDYHIVEVVNNKLKHDDVLNSDYNVMMCRKMYKLLGNNSYYESLPYHLTDNEMKEFGVALQMKADLIDLFENFDKKNIGR